MSEHPNPHPAPEADEPLPLEPTHDHPIAGHRYDGIREYDNPMPRWWVMIFWATIIWSPLYILGEYVFDWIPTYSERLAAQTERLEATRTAYTAANPTFSTEPAALAEYATNPDHAAEGAVLFATTCVACHGDKGQGGIGPNLTDDYWIHGGTPEQVFAVITKGVLDKGMPPQEATLTDEQRGQLVAFIESIHGSNPPGAKEPQGDKTEG
ncbi:MAG: c-type cytochrome [Bacteroidetes bacterium]|nr:c-type cytochrome [Bacteroidota bacterium]